MFINSATRDNYKNKLYKRKSTLIKDLIVRSFAKFH